MNKVNVLVKGFETEEQAKMFMEWFSESGEQDLSNYASEQGLEDMPMSSGSSNKKDENGNFVMKVGH